MDSSIYQPLPGRGFGPFRRDRIWLAEDHFLSISSSRFVDTYERFYFADIQAIYFREWYSQYLVILIAQLVPCFAFLILAIAHHRAWLMPLFPLATWTIAYAWLGPQGDCSTQTLLGTHAIPAVSRRPAYDQLLQRLVPLIETAQGALDIEGFTLVAPAVSDVSPPPMERLAPPKALYRGWFFEAAFITVAVAGVVSLWNATNLHGVGLDRLGNALSLVGLLLIVVALVRASRVDVGGPVIGCLWGLAGIQCLSAVSAILAATMQMAVPRGTSTPPLASLADLLPFTNAIQITCILLAIVGLLLIINQKNGQPSV